MRTDMKSTFHLCGKESALGPLIKQLNDVQVPSLMTGADGVLPTWVSKTGIHTLYMTRGILGNFGSSGLARESCSDGAMFLNQSPVGCLAPQKPI